jgi:hypothetical protein
MSSRRKKSIIQLYRTANRQFGNDSPNYNKQFGLRFSPEDESPKSMTQSINNEYKVFCIQKASNSMHKSKGPVFTRKRLTYKRKIEDCVNNEEIYKIYKILKKLSNYKKTYYSNKQPAKLNKISRIIRIKGINNVITYLLNHDNIKNILDSSDLQLLETRIKFIILNEILIDKSFKLKVKFNSRRYIK